MQEKLTVGLIDSKCVGKQETLLSKNAASDLYDATLCWIRFFGYLACWTICLFLAFLV